MLITTIAASVSRILHCSSYPSSMSHPWNALFEGCISPLILFSKGSMKIGCPIAMPVPHIVLRAQLADRQPCAKSRRLVTMIAVNSPFRDWTRCVQTRSVVLLITMVAINIGPFVQSSEGAGCFRIPCPITMPVFHIVPCTRPADRQPCAKNLRLILIFAASISPSRAQTRCGQVLSFILLVAMIGVSISPFIQSGEGQHASRFV